jgi:hypothetical protein
MINGVSNNNNVNPSGIGDIGFRNSAFLGSGEAQSIFLDTSLVESITAQTENIGAEYGGFTGGVVDAKLKDARMDRWHIMTNFRYTKDSWAKFHLTDTQQNTNQSITPDYQPEFNKYEYTISADGPINDNVGALISYGEQHSKIPRWSEYDIYKPDGTTYREKKNAYRDNKNFVIKLNTHNIDDLEASLTTIYAPYVRSDFYSESRYSDIDIKGGGLNIAYDMKNALNFGVLKNTLAYKQDGYSAEAGDDTYIWATVRDGYANWGSDGYVNVGINERADEGTMGDRKFMSKSFIYKSVLELDEFNTGLLEHFIKTGVEAEFGKVGYKRSKTNYFQLANLNASATGNKKDGIMAGEQWLSSKLVYETLDNKKSYTTAALFFEDSIKVDRYTIRSGLRISTDTVTDNTDIAPRLFANADVFDDKTLNVYGGYNRYYGGLILYDTIFEHRLNRYARTSYDASWVYDNWTIIYNYSMDGLRTPHSDEFSLGSSLSKWNTLFELDFVKREYRDQIKQKTISAVSTGSGWDRSYKNTNDGKSDYWGLTLTASKEYEFKNIKHVSEFSITKSEASNNLNGMNGFSDEDDYSQTHITYDGELKKYEDVPSPDYNAPLVIAYSHIMELSDYLRFGLNARYEKGVDGYKYVNNGGLKDHDGKDTRNYESKHYKDSFTVDLTANYDLKFKGNKLTFGVEVLNLLNRKNDADYSSSNNFVENYAMGRQFYANFRYEY